MKNTDIALRVNLPWVESPFFKTLLKEKPLTIQQKDLATHFNQEGFILVPQLVSHELIDRTLAEIQGEYPEKVGQEPARMQDLWKKYSSVREIACSPEVLSVLRMLYEREPIPFQTLNFKFGTQQRAHSDSIHFSSIPARYMCGVWVALQETNAENGPLFYYPRSHVQEEFNYFDIGIEAERNYAEYHKYEDFMEEFMEAKEYLRQEIHMQKGDVLIWSSNLVHGGMPIKGDNVTRWSQVSHYYFEGCTYYSPRTSDMFSNDLNLRQITNIVNGEIVQHTDNGKSIETINTGNSRYAVSHNFSFKVLAKELVKKIFGKKPF
jgi:hypothetical protein